jgi:hypothetical protein
MLKLARHICLTGFNRHEKDLEIRVSARTDAAIG